MSPLNYVDLSVTARVFVIWRIYITIYFRLLFEESPTSRMASSPPAQFLSQNFWKEPMVPVPDELQVKSPVR